MRPTLRRALYLCFSAFFCLIGTFVSAQTITVDTVGNPYILSKLMDPAKVNLPEVSVFLAAAENYSEVRLFDERKREEYLNLIISKREWLKYFRVLGNYQYGTDFTVRYDGAVVPPGTYFPGSEQNWYNIGLAVSIPLDDLFSRKKKNEAARSRMKQAGYQLETAVETRKIIIMETYNEVVKHLAILKVKAEAVALYEAQMSISENDFVNGKIDIISLSLERSRRSAAMVSFEESRAALYNAVTLLEILTNIKIIRE